MRKKAKFKGNCWLWQYALNKDGYGVMQKDNKTYNTHKWMYEQFKGKVPHGTELDHLCKNPSCINPEHLEPVSHAVNCRRGKNTKLTPDDIKGIRKMASNYTHQEIADKYKVSRQTISFILAGERWG